MTNIITETFPILQWFEYKIWDMPLWDEPEDWDMDEAIKLVEKEHGCSFRFTLKDENGEIVSFHFARETDETETYTIDLDGDPIYHIDINGEAMWEDELPF